MCLVVTLALAVLGVAWAAARPARVPVPVARLARTTSAYLNGDGTPGQRPRVANRP
ncbi:MAG: hypothetical protein LBI33_09085 [Propionibacteriaceae bacterium]|nr:hypothetical protein [Propionibacteriaceae bacterium]